MVTSASYGDDVQATTMPTTPSDIKSLGITNTELRSTATASITMGALDKALDKVSSYRAQYGAFINRFNKSVLAQQSIATGGEKPN